MLLRVGPALALVFVAGVAHAGDKPLYQPMPAWVEAAPPIDFAKLTDRDPAMVINDQQDRIQDGQVWSYVETATRIVSAQELNGAGQVQLMWHPDAGDLIVHGAEIIRGAERIDLVAAGQRFQVLQREQQLEQLQLNGTLTATLAVEGLRVGDVLRLVYSTTYKDKALTGHTQTFQSLLAEPARAKFARARISWPVGSAMEWRSHVEGVKPRLAALGGFNQLTVALPLAKLPEMPGDVPIRYRPLPLLEASSFADWSAVSSAMAPHYATAGAIAPGGPLAKEVEKIAARSADPRTRAALALRLVQDEVRYLFKGMDGGNYIPQKPSDTWNLRYGDCKAKTMLLLAILRDLGIEAEPALVSTELGDGVPSRLPSAGVFDHVIVRATIGGEALWLDGTSAGTRLADLGDTPPFGHALPLRTQGGQLIEIAGRPAGRPMMEMHLEVDHSAGLALPAPFTLAGTVRGPMATMMQAASSQADEEQIRAMGQMMANQLFGDALIADASISYDAEAATAVMKASGVVSTRWRYQNGHYSSMLDKTLSQVEFAPDRARAAWKDLPVAAPPIHTLAYHLRMRLPAAAEGFELEGDRSFPDPIAGARIDRQVALAGGNVTLDDTIFALGREMPAAALPAERARVALAKARLIEVRAPQSYRARWQEVAEGRRSGAFKPLLAAYAKAIANHADSALPYSNRAHFLAGVWDWKPALADLDAAIAIEPDADLHLRRSYVRLALKDDVGALADAETALELDPSSVGAASRIATLRFRKGDRDGALALIDERISAGGQDKTGYASLKSDLLAEGNQVDQAIAVLDETIRSHPGKSELFNNRCWLKGTMNVALDTALKDCTRGIEMAEEPASIYDSRALVYYRLGRIEEALADLDAALAVSPSQGASLYLRGVVRKQAGDKRGEADVAAARMMWPRIDEDYARYGIKP